MDDIGSVAWTVEDMLASLDEFREIYPNRPIAVNAGGMRAPHAFLTWFIVKQLRPPVVIESGVFKGQGTWLIETACPDAHIICLDPYLGQVQYKSGNAEYRSEDFDVIDFSELDKEHALCFFDDHQDAVNRLKSMAWKGFKKAVFEDNYAPPHGDCYSLRKAFEGVGFATSRRRRLKNAVKAVIASRVQPHADVPPNKAHAVELHANIARYWEGPPMFRLSKTRWGDNWADELFPTKEALLENDEADPLFDEAGAYTWLCYVELK